MMQTEYSTKQNYPTVYSVLAGADFKLRHSAEFCQNCGLADHLFDPRTLLYIYGPSGLSRLLVGFICPRCKNHLCTHGHLIANACQICIDEYEANHQAELNGDDYPTIQEQIEAVEADLRN